MQVQLGFIILGIAINLIAFCIWMFGPKSKTLCCATYFALNAVADFLCCTIPGISLNTVWLCAINKFKFKYPQWYADILVDIVNYTLPLLLAWSNWISASITIERAFTTVWPFVFKPKDMQTRGPRGPCNAHLRQKIFKSSLFHRFMYNRRNLEGLNMKAKA